MELHAQLTREKNPLLEWSFERIVNMDLVHGLRMQPVAEFLETIPLTSRSAVLTEKLADLYDLLGKPSSAIDAWQHALSLDPSPQQRLRLRQTLADRLLAAGRKADAAANWRQLIAESPGYPGIASVREALKILEQQLAAKNP
jgi:tetratricopeptide (TPR) repeat protein